MRGRDKESARQRQRVRETEYGRLLDIIVQAVDVRGLVLACAALWVVSIAQPSSTLGFLLAHGLNCASTEHFISNIVLSFLDVGHRGGWWHHCILLGLGSTCSTCL